MQRWMMCSVTNLPGDAGDCLWCSHSLAGEPAVTLSGASGGCGFHLPCWWARFISEGDREAGPVERRENARRDFAVACAGGLAVPAMPLRTRLRNPAPGLS